MRGKVTWGWDFPYCTSTTLTLVPIVINSPAPRHNPKKHLWLTVTTTIMSSTLPKLILPLIRPLLPYLPLLPKPILTLLPSVLLHHTSHRKLAFFAYFQDPFTNPLHPPLLLTFFLIPLIYTLGLISGNVSWVDRSWPFFTPICSGLILLWAGINDNGGLYGHNLPRLSVMMFLQVSFNAISLKWFWFKAE